MTRALLLSLLSRQALMLKASGFRERYPHAWLVWEAGVWNVPDIGEEMGSTRLPSGDIVDCLPQSDVLCFELPMPLPDSVIKVGRAAECDVVINDATVSREHLEIGFDGERFWAKPLPEAAEVTINGVPMDRIHRTPLIAGVKLVLGAVALSYHPPEAFWARVAAQAEKLAGLARAPTVTPAQGSPAVTASQL